MSRPADRPDAFEEEHGIALSAGQRRRLDAYLRAVLDETQRVNLIATGWATPEAAREMLQLPSYAVGSGWGSRPSPRVAMDIGSGNGFPGVVVAVNWPTARVLLVERRKKKAAAIERCLQSAGIDNAEVLAEDARETAAHRPELREAIDLITARAVGPVAVINRLAAPFLAPGGLVMHWKATDTSQTELRDGDRVADGEGWGARHEWTFAPVPPGPGRLVVYERPAVRTG